MTPLAPHIELLHREKPLSPVLLGAVSLAVCALFIGGQLLQLPVIAFAILPIAVAFGAFLLSSGRAALYTFIATPFALSFRLSVSKGTDPLDILVGLMMGAVAFGWLLRLLLIDREQLTYSTPQLLTALYVGWGMLVGLGGVLWFNNTLNDWIREFFICSPLLIIPILYIRFYEPDSASEKMLLRFMFFAALTTGMSAVVKYAFALTQSEYAYQIGRVASEPSPAIILLLTCVAFRLYRIKWIPLFAQLLVAAFAVGLLILGGYRTVWVATTLVVVVMFALTDRVQWRHGVRFLAYLVSLLTAIGTYLFMTMPLFKVFVLMTYGRLLTTTQLTTDPSLLNRYIETSIVERMFLLSPITGYGFGAKYQMFDWLLGYSYDTGYSHNGYFFIAFKTGIIGFCLIYGAYLWFMSRALRIMRDASESMRSRAIATIAFCYFCCALVNNLTLNIFGERTVLVWIGLFWGFIIAHEVGKRRRTFLKASLVTNE